MDAFTKEKERDALRGRIFAIRARLFSIANWRKKFREDRPDVKYSQLSNISNGLCLNESVVSSLEKFVEKHEQLFTKP